MNCRKCRTAMTVTQAERTEGRAGAVFVSLSDFPYLTCPSCGSKAFVHAEFPASLLFPLDDSLPFAAKGPHRGQSECVSCAQPLDASPSNVVSIAVRPRVDDLYEIPITIQAPGFTCRACGTTQLAGKPRAVASDLADALIAAFESIGPLNRW